MTSTSELLLEWDRRRPRSQQRQFGMSELGGCRRRAGYRLAGVEPTDAPGSVQAVLGTAIHAAVASVLAEAADPGDLVEFEVEFSGIVGHIDRYEAADHRLRDVKSTSSRWLSHIRVHGPGRAHIYQTAAYGAALIKAGHPVRSIALDYLARDTGEEWTHERPFNPAEVKAALEWLEQVRAVGVDMLPREYAPDSAFCRHCPFRSTCWSGGVEGRDPRSVLFLENPDAAKWAQQLWDAREAKKQAEKLEAEAKGALDALRPDSGGVVDVGWSRPLVWTVAKPAQRLDTAAVKAEYARIGAEPPYKVGKPSVRLGFADDAEENES